MRNDTTFRGGGDDQQGKLPAGVQRIDDVLDELLAQFSAQFPQFKIVVLSPTDALGPGGMEFASQPVSV
jgi:hypothetical protein